MYHSPQKKLSISLKKYIQFLKFVLNIHFDQIGEKSRFVKFLICFLIRKFLFPKFSNWNRTIRRKTRRKKTNLLQLDRSNKKRCEEWVSEREPQSVVSHSTVLIRMCFLVGSVWTTEKLFLFRKTRYVLSGWQR